MTRILLVFLLFGAGMMGAARAAGDDALKAGSFTPPRLAPDFTLTGSTGAELRLSQFRGKVVLLGFGFTSCPDVCPTTLAVLAEARKRLGAQRDQVQVLYVTVDPERDVPARLRQYLNAFDPSFIGGTGSAEQLATLRKNYGVVAERKAAASGYVYAHSSSTYLIGRDGRLRGMMPYGHPAEDYVHDLRLLLAK